MTSNQHDLHESETPLRMSCEGNEIRKTY